MGSLVPGSTNPYSIAPFIIDVADFALCGFKEYQVTAVKKGTQTSITVTNPHQGQTCNTVSACLTRKFDTSVERTITVTIKASTYEPKAVSASFDISIGCIGLPASYTKVFNFDAAKTRQDSARITLPFAELTGSSGCGVKSIVLANKLDGSSLITYPDGNTKQGFVQIDNSKLGSFSFKATSTLFF